MAKASVAQDKAGCEKVMGRPEVVKLDAEDAMNAIAILDDVLKAASRAKLEAIERYDDVMRKALRAKQSLAQSIAKHERRSNSKAVAA